MRVEVKENTNKIKSDFPKLMISNNGTIILAEYDDGINLWGIFLQGNVEPPAYNIGYYSRNWNKDIFKPFHGTITLTED